MKAIVISGGGSWGAGGGGTITANCEDYDLILGVSTGALLAPMVALGYYDRIKEIYTTTGQKDVFNVNPVNSKGHIRVLNAVIRTLMGKTSFGETLNLKKLIKVCFTESDYNEIKRRGKEVIVAAQNLQSDPARIEYKSTKNCNYDDFCDWLFASSSPPIMGSYLEKDGYQYTDAGLTEIISIRKAIEMGATEIDVIMHRTRLTIANSNHSDKPKKTHIKNMFHAFGRYVDIMRYEIERNDLLDGIELAKMNKCKLNINWLPSKPDFSSMVFDKAKMEALYNRCLFTANDVARNDSYDYR